MNQSLLLIGVLILTSCQPNKKPGIMVASTSSNDTATVTYPIPVLYSGTWEMGDPRHAINILNLGKEWSAGTFEGFKTGLADSMVCYMADGSILRGSRDSMIAKFTTFRQMYSEILLETHSIVSLRHRDTKENWVCLWGKEIMTTIQGKKDSVELQESWRLDSTGKADLVYQYALTVKPPKN